MQIRTSSPADPVSGRPVRHYRIERMTDRQHPEDHHSLLWTRWSEVDSLFDEALDLPAGERAAFLREKCGADSELFSLVARLLRTADANPDLIDRPGGSLLRAAWRATPDP